MIDNDLQKRLKGDLRFIPYNDKFDYEYVKNYIHKNKDKICDWELAHKALSTMFFNLYYTELIDQCSSLIDRTTLSKQSIVEILISLLNRDLYLLTEKANDSIRNRENIIYDEIANFSIKSSIPELGNFNAQGSIEAKHDALNIILNLLNRFDNISINNQIIPDHLDDYSIFLNFTNIYTVIKHSYEVTIWQDYMIRYSNKSNELYILDSENKSSIINRIGTKRFDRNIFASKQGVMSEYYKKTDFYNILSNQLYKNRKAKRLKSVSINNYNLHYKLADGVEKKSIIIELMHFATLSVYYPFIGNEKLPNFDNLSLHDLITIFSEIQYLLENASNLEKKESDNIITSFDLFKLIINRNDLINYLISKTKYTNDQIKQVITLLSHKDGIYNIWERPIMSYNNLLIPLLMPIIATNILRLIDYWLEKGGLDLEFRGKLFERHLKIVIQNDINKKGYFVNILDQNDFRNINNDHEEIDLIFELKTIIVIAEIKCVKFPFDPRDYHNMYNRLKDGSVQVKRKTDFIKSNVKDFQNKFNDASKEIISVIITNYPIYSGLIINNIPVIDLSLLENYLGIGSLNKSKLSHRFGDSIKVTDYQEPILYYSNETEFSNNLNHFLFDPIPIKDLKKEIHTTKKQISLPNAIPKILMDFVQFKDSIVI